MDFAYMEKLKVERDALLREYPDAAPYIWEHYIEMMQKALMLI